MLEEVGVAAEVETRLLEWRLRIVKWSRREANIPPKHVGTHYSKGTCKQV
jgi:hypothetical protein